MFITFEGLDFCGKSTQVKLLENYLKEKNKNVIVIREPGGTAISEQIRKILLDRINDSMKNETELLLFAASRAQLVHEIILPYLQKKYYVISDRFHDSSIAYQAFGRNLQLEFVIQLQKFVIGNAIPDITFFIDIPVEEVLNRMSKVKNIELDRIETSPDGITLRKIQFYERVRNGYLYLCERESRIKKIDGLLSIEEIHNIIIKYLESVK
ncbi:MAG: dTMP kinase [Melioribacter sp.]|uniref:dTMP kinase n=1 Tax=Rosettibacter primus TaxID=3111523 RepID=UPI00247E8657|nr:dTMP kinase [Melioribacter sp.]